MIERHQITMTFHFYGNAKFRKYFLVLQLSNIQARRFCYSLPKPLDGLNSLEDEDLVFAGPILR
jgi:hypothetical protein